MADEPIIDECDNCNYQTQVTEYDTGFPRRKYKFCTVCASTYLSRGVSYPNQYGQQAPLFASLGYIANMILDEIKKTQPPSPPAEEIEGVGV